jgi:hypothetical protein
MSKQTKICMNCKHSEGTRHNCIPQTFDENIIELALDRTKYNFNCGYAIVPWHRDFYI